MKEFIILLFFFILSPILSHGQKDTIITNENKIYLCKIISVKNDEIRFIWYEKNNKEKKLIIRTSKVLYCNSDVIKIDNRTDKSNDNFITIDKIIPELTAGDYLILAKKYKNISFVCYGIGIGFAVLSATTGFPALFIVSGGISLTALVYSIVSNQQIGYAGEKLNKIEKHTPE